MEKDYKNAMIIFDNDTCGFANLTNVERNDNRVTGGFAQTRGFKSLQGRTIKCVLVQYDVNKKNQEPHEEDLF